LAHSPVTMPTDTENPDRHAPGASWSDNEGVAALHAVADTVDQLARAMPERRIAGEAPPTDDAELPIRNLPSHLQFARYWRDRGEAYLRQAEIRTCPVCRADDSTPWFHTQDGYRYDICNRCRMTFIPAVVPMEAWDRYFAELPDARSALAAQMEAAVSTDTEQLNRQRFGRYFDVLRRHGAAQRGHRLLDIGTFTGGSLRVATEQGMDAFGVEGLQEAVRFCHQRFPDQRVALAHAESLDPATFGGGFDVVTMWETLEHTFDPIAALAGARAVLRPGGWLAITVPNARNLQFSMLRDYCFYAYGGYQGVGHLNMFTPETLRLALEENGFDVVHEETEFGTDWRQIAYYLQHRFDRIYCFRNLIRLGEFTQAPGPELSQILNWLSPALSRLENACLAGPIALLLAKQRPERSGRTPAR
jgi:2-polyprenyl-3-methyl-5-hydroxy-6-metoxy-1,4-benzoquinol methylase